MPTPQDPSEYLADLRRSRQHGADLTVDHNRGRAGNLAFRTVAYGAALLITSAVLYVAANAAISEENHAPQAPAALANPPHQP